MAFLKLVAKIDISALPSRLRMHALHTSLAHPCLWTYTVVIIIWQAQNGDPTRAYRSSKTPDKCRVCVLRDIDPYHYGAEIP